MPTFIIQMPPNLSKGNKVNPDHLGTIRASSGQSLRLKSQALGMLRCKKKRKKVREGNFRSQMQGSQSTWTAPQVSLPQSWMNFSMEKTPVRSSTDRPYSSCLPLVLTMVSLDSHPM
jgi:hypothetical protein